MARPDHLIEELLELCHVHARHFNGDLFELALELLLLEEFGRIKGRRLQESGLAVG